MELCILSPKRNCHPGLLYMAKLSFRIKGEIKTFKDKHKLKHFMTSKSPL
jgi:hypothetical protein